MEKAQVIAEVVMRLTELEVVEIEGVCGGWWLEMGQFGAASVATAAVSHCIYESRLRRELATGFYNLASFEQRLWQGNRIFLNTFRLVGYVSLGCFVGSIIGLIVEKYNCSTTQQM